MNADQTFGIWLLFFIIVGYIIDGSPGLGVVGVDYYLNWIGFSIAFIGGTFFLFKGTDWNEFTLHKWIDKLG